jgi:hypothetical protein
MNLIKHIKEIIRSIRVQLNARLGDILSNQDDNPTARR